MSQMASLPFEIVRVQQDNSWLERARFTCARCSAHASFPLVRGRSINPEATIKAAAAAGWDVKKHSARAECPRCLASRRKLAAGEKPNKPIAEVNMLPSKPLTNDQRLAIRALLDKHFDDGTGRYLDGFTDARVAEDCKVARVHVETIRDAAYGAIRVPPEMEAAERSVRAVEAKVELASKVLADLQSLIDAAKRDVPAARRALGLAA